ncbi:hypothetical protein BDY21DRAFT_333277 [Lineolata rhizophorae]|uniref:Uncharacterized protein n=1 Tax=Lineolata rhizophorae TaxID=578093 RepID=A0A6A6PBF1_9PEZI|nr:hypothetical protein BDY21DRAFT_333277 [Lineolata rhizophorae]
MPAGPLESRADAPPCLRRVIWAWSDMRAEPPAAGGGDGDEEDRKGAPEGAPRASSASPSMSPSSSSAGNAAATFDCPVSAFAAASHALKASSASSSLGIASSLSRIVLASAWALRSSSAARARSMGPVAAAAATLGTCAVDAFGGGLASFFWAGAAWGFEASRNRVEALAAVLDDRTR